MSFYCMLLGWLPLTAECVPILSQNRIPSTKYQWLFQVAQCQREPDLSLPWMVQITGMV